MTKRPRNRVSTELAILDALEALLTAEGFDSLGVNAIAQRAGVSKELIYRYFGGLEGVLLAWMEERDYWSFRKIDQSQERLLRAGADAEQMTRESLLTFARELRGNVQLQEIRRWEVHSRSPLALRIAGRREEAGRRVVSRIPEAGADVAAIYGLLQAGLCYLVLRSSALETYCGVGIRTDEGWKRIEGAVEAILAAVLGSGETWEGGTAETVDAADEPARRRSPPDGDDQGR